MKIDCSQDYPIITYGGSQQLGSNSGEMYLFRNAHADDPQDTEITLLYHSDLTGTDRGWNFVNDCKTYSTVTESGYERLSNFITNTSGIGGVTFVRELHYDYRDVVWAGDYETVNEHIPFSGYVTHLETTNMQPNPFRFVSTSGFPGTFYQK
jgi:hypothetical protein